MAWDRKEAKDMGEMEAATTALKARGDVAIEKLMAGESELLKQLTIGGLSVLWGVVQRAPLTPYGAAATYYALVAYVEHVETLAARSGKDENEAEEWMKKMSGQWAGLDSKSKLH